MRVAFIAGTLGQGGAEKQLVYMARALLQMDVTVRVLSLTRGEFYGQELRRSGVEVQWVGHWANPLVRLLTIGHVLRTFEPDILQSSHFYTNLYAALLSRVIGAAAVGAIRNDTLHELECNRCWGKWLLRLPPILACNSYTAYRNAVSHGVSEDRLSVLPNVIDLDDFDGRVSSIPQTLSDSGKLLAITVSRLVRVKRLDRFIRALAIARKEVPVLQGVIIGDGPERDELESLGRKAGLTEKGLSFAGTSHDVPTWMSQAHMLVHPSDHEGFPNVLLEAMAARLPVVTTPAGDAARIVQDQVTGFVVPFDDVRTMAERMVALARSPALRSRMGGSGRAEVEKRYSCERLPAMLLGLYRQAAERTQSKRLLAALSQCCFQGEQLSAD